MRLFRPGSKPTVILDFDVETRPLHWYGGDWVSKEVTAIAWKFIDHGHEHPPMVVALGDFDEKGQRLFQNIYGQHDIFADHRSMLANFLEAYNHADMVTGHFIRGFDLPVLTAQAIEVGLDPLPDKLTQDTKIDLVKMSGLSKSMENLGATFELEHPKVIMDQGKWREANRLTAKGIAHTQERVVGDVIEHIELRQKLHDRNLLGRPRMWSARSNGGTGGYTP